MNILNLLVELILEQFIETEINILDIYRNNFKYIIYIYKNYLLIGL